MNFIIPIMATFGFYNITSWINNKLNLKKDNFYFSIIFFILSLSLIVVLLALKADLNLISLPLLIILSLSFINFFYSNFNKIFSFLKKNTFIVIILVFFSILSLIPIAGADSYAYHLAWPRRLINDPSIFFDKLFLESRVVGIGEIINYLGLLIGTENLLSFLSFIILATYILLYKKKQRFLIFLFLTSTPIIYKYLIDQKPFLLPCLILIIFIENLFNKIEYKNIKDFDIYAFIIALSFFANSKYPFLIIGLIIYIYFFYLSLKKNFFKKYLISSLIIFIIHFLPLPFMKFIYFGDPFSPFFEGVFNNADNDILRLKEMYKTWDGFKISSDVNSKYQFINFLRNFFNFFFPIAPYTILDTFGSSVLIFFLFYNEFKKKIIFYFIIFFTTLILVLVTNFQSRWFFFIFFYLTLSIGQTSLNIKSSKIFKNFLIFISSILLMFHFVYLSNIIKNSLQYGFENTKEKYIYLYKDFKDLKKISQDNFILTNTRGSYFSENIINYNYQILSKKYLILNKNIDHVRYGYFSTGTNQIQNDELYSGTLLKNFEFDCLKIINNRYNLVAKRNIFSRKDYENFVLVEFKKPLLKCLK